MMNKPLLKKKVLILITDYENEGWHNSLECRRIW